MNTRTIASFGTATLTAIALAACGGGGGGGAPQQPPPNNAPPTANAGPDQTADEGTTVQLAGSGTDPEGAAVIYLWSQVSGPAVTLSSVADPNATFEAPEVPVRNTVPVVLSLQVTDAAGQSSTRTR